MKSTFIFFIFLLSCSVFPAESLEILCKTLDTPESDSVQIVVDFNPLHIHVGGYRFIFPNDPLILVSSEGDNDTVTLSKLEHGKINLTAKMNLDNVNMIGKRDVSLVLSGKSGEISGLVKDSHHSNPVALKNCTSSMGDFYIKSN